MFYLMLNSHYFTVYLVLQRRVDNSISFQRGWNDYISGFGDSEGNFWLGLEKIHHLTSKHTTSLNVSLQAHDGTNAYAYYSLFYVGDADTKYQLSVSGYSGSAGDSLSYHSGSKFTTFDQDNDEYGTNCAIYAAGAWWYKSCFHSNLNSMLSGASTTAKQASWNTFKQHNVLRLIEMKLHFSE